MNSANSVNTFRQNSIDGMFLSSLHFFQSIFQPFSKINGELFLLILFQLTALFCRSGSIIVSYALLFVATKENDPDTIHPILTNILQAGQGAITATVELGLVETVTIVISMYNE